ncbi:hypothetical protein HY993_04110 [Candidatus Micrarchaeota archaeon]|nr:hypothetical protein [Candidatus Micrarchaeota archaeon]
MKGKKISLRELEKLEDEEDVREAKRILADKNQKTHTLKEFEKRHKIKLRET